MCAVQSRQKWMQKVAITLSADRCRVWHGLPPKPLSNIRASAGIMLILSMKRHSARTAVMSNSATSTTSCTTTSACVGQLAVCSFFQYLSFNSNLCLCFCPLFSTRRKLILLKRLMILIISQYYHKKQGQKKPHAASD